MRRDAGGADAPTGPVARARERRRSVLAGLRLAAAPGLLALWWGCATAGGATQNADGRASDGGDVRILGSGFEREIVPFEVRDASGRPYEHALLGGLEVPRPQLVDIDGDGDLDLFVQERTGELVFFENTGTSAEARFVWRTDRWMDLDIGEWSRFHDLDGDGDLDLLAERPFSYIRYYRNDGTPGEPRWTSAADSLKDAAGKPIFSDRQNIPAVVDLDCDDRLDLFLGRVDGTVTRYEEVARREGGVPVFDLVTDRFEDIEIVAQISMPGGPPGPPGGTIRHGANSMAFADIDHDGDLDFFWGDYFEPGLLWIENVGTCARPNLRSEPVPAPATELIATSGYNAPYLADIDDDGDLDLFIGVLGGAFNANRTASSNLRFYAMNDRGLFDRRTVRLLDAVDLGSESVVSIADLDGDGDLDLLVGSKLDTDLLQTGRVYRFENVGSRDAPAYQLADSTTLLEAYHLAPELADLDGDGRAELLLGTWNDDVHLYRMAGGGDEVAWEPVSDGPILELPRGSHSVPAAGDLDGDGLPDLVVGESSGELNLFRNVGTGAEPAFELVTERLGGIDVGRRSAPTLVDLDGDGDLDLLVGREEGGALVFVNEGWVDEEPTFAPGPELDADLPRFSRPIVADLDGDGRPDLISGSAGGGLVLLRNVRAGG